MKRGILSVGLALYGSLLLLALICCAPIGCVGKFGTAPRPVPDPAVPVAAAKSSVLAVTPSSVAFGSVLDTNIEARSVTFTNPGTTAVTVSAVAATGSDQFVTSETWPVNVLPFTLAAGASKSVLVIFAPTASGSFSATFTVGGAVLTMSGTGVPLGPSYEVGLTWDAPAVSTDPVVGYNVYRAPAAGSYQLLNASINVPTTFTDATVMSGRSYSYEVTSVDAFGVESVPSNVYVAAIP
jgi:hypothetical protein